MELKVGMRLSIERSGSILTLIDVSEEKVIVYCDDFVGEKELDFNKTYIENCLLHGILQIVRDRKNNFW